MAAAHSRQQCAREENLNALAGHDALHLSVYMGDAHLAASRQGLQGGLLDFDVQQAQRVQAPLPVGCYARVEAVWPPAVSEKTDGHCLQN